MGDSQISFLLKEQTFVMLLILLLQTEMCFKVCFDNILGCFRKVMVAAYAATEFGSSRDSSHVPNKMQLWWNPASLRPGCELTN